MSLFTLAVTGPIIESDVLKYFVDEDYCKIGETLAAGSGSDDVAEIGTVLGRVKSATIAVGAPATVGTGNGVLTRASPAYSNDAMQGSYKVIFDAVVANAGEFLVERPDGTIDGRGRVGVAYAGQVKFTIADGATDFVAGDVISLAVTVSAPTYKYAAINFAATDGTQNAAAISLSKRTATDGGSDQAIVVLRRGPAIVDKAKLIWPGGATADQKDTALAQLEALGIIARSS